MSVWLAPLTAGLLLVAQPPGGGASEAPSGSTTSNTPRSGNRWYPEDSSSSVGHSAKAMRASVKP